MNVADVMDELAAAVQRVPSLAGRTYAYPVDDISEPAAFVPFPAVDFDATYGRGSDDMDMTIVVIVGRLSDRSDRDRVVGYMDGAGGESIKAAVEGYEYTTIDYAHVASVATTDYTIAGVEYWALVFEVEVTGSGTT